MSYEVRWTNGDVVPCDSWFDAVRHVRGAQPECVIRKMLPTLHCVWPSDAAADAEINDGARTKVATIAPRKERW